MIRCVSIKPDKKTGEYAVKFLSESVVNNRFFMKKYGWRVEEIVAEKPAPKTAQKEQPKAEPETQDLNVADPEEFAEVPEPEFIEAPAIEAPKTEAPVKPKATRAKRKTTKK